MIKILILCGGSGTRLFPLSRETLPKQFAPLLPEETLFQKTLKRSAKLLQALDEVGEIHIITNTKHYFLAQEQSLAISCPITGYLLEDSPRDSGAALILSALCSQAEDLILALPSDHIIHSFPSFLRSVQDALKLAAQGGIVSFGIKPRSPHTGYGYIRAQGNAVLEFCEKPSLQKAEQFLAQGDYFWNSGMFCFQAQSLLQECQSHCPTLLAQCQRVVESSSKEHNFIWLKGMETIEKISIDYALMEKTKHALMVRGEFEWNDVGSFDSLLEEFSQDEEGNVSQAPLVSRDAHNNFIHAKKLISLIGVQDLAIIDTKDALLISQKGRTQEVKELIKQIQNTEILQAHSLVYRPWGSYEVLEEGRFYKIKQIIVKPQKRLSLQKHYHRNEHWIVVSGSACVQVGDQEIFLQSNESTYIPMGTPHRLSNQGKLDLIIIEVQVGEYLGEDDIVRIEDDFHRA